MRRRNGFVGIRSVAHVAQPHHRCRDSVNRARESRRSQIRLKRVVAIEFVDRREDRVRRGNRARTRNIARQRLARYRRSGNHGRTLQSRHLTRQRPGKTRCTCRGRRIARQRTAEGARRRAAKRQAGSELTAAHRARRKRRIRESDRLARRSRGVIRQIKISAVELNRAKHRRAQVSTCRQL